MAAGRDNEYECVFEAWLADEGVHFARVEQSHRCIVGTGAVKTFDYIIYPKGQGCVLVELKGRLFRGDSLAGRRRLECWTPREEATALTQWQARFAAERPAVEAAFVFVYRLANVAADEDGLAVYDWQGRRYVFLAIRLEDYRRGMRRRSVQWNTVTLPAADFRRYSFPAERLWKNNSL